MSPREIALQGPFNGVESSTRSTEKELFMLGRDSSLGDGFTQTGKRFVLEIRASKHLIKRGSQLRGEGALNLQTQIAPTAGDTIAFEFGRDVEPTHKGDALIADQQLAVVTDAESIQRDGIENAHFPTQGSKWFPESGGEAIGT